MTAADCPTPTEGCGCPPPFVVGAIWRRKRSGALLRISWVWNVGGRSPYYDIAWETVDKPIRRGNSYETYWLRNCEPVEDPA